MFNSRHRPASANHLALALALLLAAFALRVARLDVFGLWDGEMWTLYHAARPLSEWLALFKVNTAHPPLWFLITKLTLTSPPNLWLVRFPAALAGTSLVAATYALARRMLSPGWSLLAMLLVVVSPLAIRWSQSARMYVGLMLFSTLALYFLLRSLENRDRLAWLGLFLSLFLDLYTQYMALLVVAGGGLFTLIVASEAGWRGWQIDRRASSAWRAAWHKLRQPVVGFGLAGAGFLPWFVAIARSNLLDRQAQREAASVAEASVANWRFLYRAFEELAGGTGIFTILLVALVLAGLAYFVLNRQFTHTGLFVLSALVPVIVVLVAKPRRFHARYVAFLTPLIAILVAAGVALVARLVRGRLKAPPRFTPVAPGILALLALLTNLRMNYAYYAGDAAAYALSTEPNTWDLIGPYPDFANEIAGGGRAMLFLQRHATTDMTLQTSMNMRFNSAAEARLIHTEWGGVNALNLWWLGNSDDWFDELSQESAWLHPQIVIEGPNLYLARSQVKVVGAREILPNGNFEFLSRSPATGSQVPAYWVVPREFRESFSVVREPTTHGTHAVEISLYPARMQSYRVDVQPGTILQASMQVLNAFPGESDIIPDFQLRFLDVDENLLDNSFLMYYRMPFDDLGADGWQLVVAQTLVPSGAREVLFVIRGETQANPLGTPPVIDDAHLIEIQVRPPE